MANGELLTVGQLAKKMGVTVRTLQYYDRVGLLKPTALSEGGRRLYSARDMVRLHQILSLKYLGFSLQEIQGQLFNLDTPQQVADMLDRQEQLVRRQIDELNTALEALVAFRGEVLQMNTVDFDRYADIIALLRMHNESYWILKLFDTDLNDHVRRRFADRPELGTHILESYHSMVDEILALKQAGCAPENEEAIDLGRRWWQMILEFTGGDMDLLPKLMDFNQSKAGWAAGMAEKQSEIDAYMGALLGAYFEREGIHIPELEEK
ncbi:MerR family transcriptional regulator [Anaerofilum sp. BX8]|uniref:MerR family transcriptional regulator n=1 Tax=Anaerofilum hominis TaxID=2763016 RepID=A0A923I5K4_9FIRM|nr:MerR family transcriptional regulator [Anaerofilum hominis]MBC5580189.1 MerR family transcriptional regulator [Anaerofilum hominis]